MKCPKCGYEDRFHGGPVASDLDQEGCRIDQVDPEIVKRLKPKEDIVIEPYVYRWNGKTQVHRMLKAVYDSRREWPNRWKVPKFYYDKYQGRLKP